MILLYYMQKQCATHDKKIVSQLQGLGLKSTPTRRRLLDIFEHAQTPLSIKQLSRQLGRAAADPATIYRNVVALTKLGLIKELHLSTKVAYYEMSDSAHHHHIVCQRCGTIADIAGCDLVPFEQSVLKYSRFKKVTAHSLEFFGICTVCAQA